MQKCSMQRHAACRKPFSVASTALRAHAQPSRSSRSSRVSRRTHQRVYALGFDFGDSAGVVGGQEGWLCLWLKGVCAAQVPAAGSVMCAHLSRDNVSPPHTHTHPHSPTCTLSSLSANPHPPSTPITNPPAPASSSRGVSGGPAISPKAFAAFTLKVVSGWAASSVSHTSHLLGGRCLGSMTCVAHPSPSSSCSSPTTPACGPPVLPPVPPPIPHQKANSLLIYSAVMRGAVGEALLALMAQSQKYQV